jgi:hypothetical protein
VRRESDDEETQFEQGDNYTGHEGEGGVSYPAPSGDAARGGKKQGREIMAFIAFIDKHPEYRKFRKHLPGITTVSGYLQGLSENAEMTFDNHFHLQKQTQILLPQWKTIDLSIYKEYPKKIKFQVVLMDILNPIIHYFDGADRNVWYAYLDAFCSSRCGKPKIYESAARVRSRSQQLAHLYSDRAKARARGGRQSSCEMGSCKPGHIAVYR